VTAFVLDNSVTMRWCFDSGTHAYADNVLRQLNSGAEALVPVLWRYEVSSVLARAQNTAIINAQSVANFLTNISALNIITDMEGTDHILGDVHQLAVTYRLTTYDAAYLELTLRKNLALATLDDDLRKACLKAGGSIFLL
jgi:predicted nucleic acid-binding protein